MLDAEADQLCRAGRYVIGRGFGRLLLGWNNCCR